MAEKQRDEAPAVDPLEQVRAADAEAAEAQTAIKKAQVAEVIDTDAEVRESELRMSAAMGKEVDRHQKVLERAQEKKLKALEALDTPTYFANVWGKGERRVIFYQCGYCPVDEQDEEAMRRHQADAHLTDLRDAGPIMRDRNGVLIEREEG